MWARYPRTISTRSRSRIDTNVGKSWWPALTSPLDVSDGVYPASFRCTGSFTVAARRKAPDRRLGRWDQERERPFCAPLDHFGNSRLSIVALGQQQQSRGSVRKGEECD